MPHPESTFTIRGSARSLPEGLDAENQADIGTIISTAAMRAPPAGNTNRLYWENAMNRCTDPRRSLSLLSIVTLCILNLVVAVTTADDFGTVAAADRIAAKKVVELIQSQHLLRQAIDDTISQRALERMIKSLDPSKSYFLKADVTEFESKYKFQLDDDLKAGNFAVAFEVFKRYRDRVDQVTAIVDQWLDVPHDFTVDEAIITDRNLVDYPADEAELRERWRQRVKYNILVFRGESQMKLSPEERLRKRTHAIAKRWHQFDNDDVVELFISSITTSFDPHTSYMSKTTFTNFLIQLRLQLEGIGATLSADDDGYIVVRQVVTGGAAYKQGELKVEDRIVGVAQGDTGEMIDAVGMKQDDVVQMIRGKAGTVVRLSILKPNDEVKEIRIVRERIELEDQAAKSTIFEEGQKPDGTPWRIGVIQLPSFYADESGAAGGRSSTTDVDRLLKEFNRQNVDALVLDLRKNGGGSLREAIDLSGLFIDYGPIVQVKNPFNQVQVHRDERRGKSWDKPLVVLTSKFSASASEILAGAIKDWGAGIVVGDSTTHGKGTVQSLVDLNSVFFRNESAQPQFGALKLTIQQFYRPNGDSTQKRGVESDIVLPSLTDHIDNIAESDLDFAIEYDRVSAARDVRDQGRTNSRLIQELSERSQQRIAASDDFAKELKRIENYLAAKKETSIPLNEEKFLARKREIDAEKEDEQVLEQQVNSTGNEIEKTFYLEEVLRITSDYALALSTG